MAEVIKGFAIRGDVFKFKNKLKIVDFATGTDEEIATMLEAHYNG